MSQTDCVAKNFVVISEQKHDERKHLPRNLLKLFAVDESIVCEACGTMKSTETFFTTKENKQKTLASLEKNKQTNKTHILGKRNKATKARSFIYTR